jgi:hypothetical protein
MSLVYTTLSKAVGIAGALAVPAVAYDVLRPREILAQTFQFRLVEATIEDVHRGIREGQITCQGLVQAYVNRARAYNGTTTRLITEDVASEFFPNYSEYKAAVTATAALPLGDPRKMLEGEPRGIAEARSR